MEYRNAARETNATDVSPSPGPMRRGNPLQLITQLVPLPVERTVRWQFEGAAGAAGVLSSACLYRGRDGAGLKGPMLYVVHSAAPSAPRPAAQRVRIGHA